MFLKSTSEWINLPLLALPFAASAFLGSVVLVFSCHPDESVVAAGFCSATGAVFPIASLLTYIFKSKYILDH